MKSVMISIQPRHLAKILSCEKRIEVRKLFPDIAPPFRCFLYCTLNGCNEFFREDLKGDVAAWNRGKWSERKGKVVAEFICNKKTFLEADIDAFGVRHLYNTAFIQRAMCLTEDELFQYLYRGKGKKNTGWGLHISELVIYHTPMDIIDFYKPCISPEFQYCPNCPVGGEYISESELEALAMDGECSTEWYCNNRLRRPPQSWCYVEGLPL